MTAMLLGALIIFCLRVIDVSIGTVRVLFVMRGKKWVAAGLGLCESAIFITAMAQVVRDMTPVKMIGYAMGYAAGILVGITIEQWIAAGQVMVRVVSGTKSVELRDRLWKEGYGLTAVRGEGREQEVHILFIVSQRKSTTMLLKLINEVDPHAFVTVDAVSQAIGGYMRPGALQSAMGMKK